MSFGLPSFVKEAVPRSQHLTHSNSPQCVGQGIKVENLLFTSYAASRSANLLDSGQARLHLLSKSPYSNGEPLWHFGSWESVQVY